MRDYDYIIVGAGASGLTLARRLQESHFSVLVLEKSRGFGGRMCHRRVEDGVLEFGHGCQGFQDTPVIRDWIEEFDLQPDLSKLDEPLEVFGHEIQFIAPQGMSRIGRRLAEGLQVERTTRVTSLSLDSGQFRVHTEEGSLFHSHQLIMTCPAPQVRQILESDETTFQVSPGTVAALGQPDYVASFSFLVGLEADLSQSSWHSLALDENFQAFNMTFRHSLKGSAVLVVANSVWSQENFEVEETQAQITLQNHFVRLDMGRISSFQMHRWKYAIAEDQGTGSQRFLRDAEHYFYCAGDAFGNGFGVSAAIDSANHLSSLLLSDTASETL